MAAIADLSELVNLHTGGGAAAPQNVHFFKSPRILGVAPAAPIAGRDCSLWTYDGHPAAGVAPTTVEAPTNATLGALPFTSAGGGRESWLTQFWATGLVGGTLILYDRLLHIGGLSGTSTSAQTVAGTLTRNTGGAGNIIWAEIYTIVGTTGTTITASYTDQDGNAGATTAAVAFGNTAFREVTRCIKLPLASGDSGVRAVASATLAASTTTAGNFGITVAKPIAYLGLAMPGAAAWRDYVTGLPGIPEIETAACLSLLWVPQSTTAPEITGGYSIVES